MMYNLGVLQYKPERPHLASVRARSGKLTANSNSDPQTQKVDESPEGFWVEMFFFLFFLSVHS